MTTPIKRMIAKTTDDEDEAFEVLQQKRSEPGGSRWDMARVREMTEPPKTTHKWCVFRNIEEG